MVMSWVKIPHGKFLVDISDEDLWRSIKMEFIFRGMPWEEEDPGHRATFKPLTPIEFYMIATTCPCRRHMTELAEAMGFTESGYQPPPPPF